MMPPLRRTLYATLLTGAVALYVLLSYFASSSTHPPLLAVVVSLLPLMAGMIAASWRSSYRLRAVMTCLVVFAMIALNIDRLLSHAAWFYLAQHLVAMASLGLLFGSTLYTRDGALCSRIAKLAIAAPLDTRYLHYTWCVTFAWAIYFTANALVSISLFWLAPLPAWAFFTTVLTPISLGVMFGAEFLIRLRILPDRPHFSIVQTIRSYRQYMHERQLASGWRPPPPSARYIK